MGKTAAPHLTAKLAHALSLLLAAGLPVLSLAAPPKTSGCLIEPDQTADIGTSVTGVIEQLPVALGEAVTAGQAVVVLRADVERANAQVADTRSRVDADAKAAQANAVLAHQKVKRTQQLMAQDFVSAQAVDQAVAEAEVADQKYKLAKSQQQIYQQEQSVARAQLSLRTLRSPITGVVVERYSNLGERVDDRPVMRIASIDPLRVSLMIPISQYGQIKVGDLMTIRPELPGIGPINATVNYVDKVVDAASNTYRVRLLLPNPDHRLPGGLRCKADTLAKASTPPPAPTPATPPAAVSSRTPLAPVSLQMSTRPDPATWHTTPPPPPRTAVTDVAALTLKPTWSLTARTPPTASPQRASAPERPVWLTASLSMRLGR